MMFRVKYGNTIPMTISMLPDDDQYCSDLSESEDDSSDSDLEPFTPEDDEQCIFVGYCDSRYGLRERPVCV